MGSRGTQAIVVKYVFVFNDLVFDPSSSLAKVMSDFPQTYQGLVLKNGQSHLNFLGLRHDDKYYIIDLRETHEWARRLITVQTSLHSAQHLGPN